MLLEVGGVCEEMAEVSGDLQEDCCELVDSNKNAVLFSNKESAVQEHGGDQKLACVKAMDSKVLSLGLDVTPDIKGATEGAASSPEDGVSYGYTNGALPCASRAINMLNYNFTPINSPQQDDSFMSCASRFNLQEENGHTVDGMRPEAHPYLDWEELFALTDYVQVGFNRRRGRLKNDDVSPSAFTSQDTLALPEINSPKSGEINDENSIASSRSSSDLFDVFVNPVHHSTSDETDNDEVRSTDSTSESTTSLCSETDSDTTSSTSSRPHKSSLRDPRRPKTPPGTPTKKSVRFADALGLDLETVRHILDQDPCPSPPVPQFSVSGHNNQRIFRPVLRLCFEQPGGRADFLSRIYRQNVCLENVVVSDMTVMGTIKVRNLAFQKEVRVRYSWDNWNSHANILAMYVAGSCDGPTDRFTFGFTVPRRYTGLGDQIFLAVFYSVGGQEYWDNNDGYNYLLLIEEEVKVLKGAR